MLPYKKVLCPTDFSEASYAGLKYGVEMARYFGAELHVVYVVPAVPPLPTDPSFVYEMPEYERALHVDAERKLKEVVEQLVPSGLTTHAKLGHGDPASEIARMAQDEGVDVIVIATHGLTGWRHLVFGSVAEKVVRVAECPVLTVRAPRP